MSILRPTHQVLFIASAVFSLITNLGCGGGLEDKLIGKWESAPLKFAHSPNPEQMFLHFQDGGKVAFGLGSEKARTDLYGEWKVESPDNEASFQVPLTGGGVVEGKVTLVSDDTISVNLTEEGGRKHDKVHQFTRVE